MAKINGISNIESTNYNVNSLKGNTDNSGFETYLGESRSLDQIFDQAADKYNVPVELLKAIGKQESNFNPSAVSRCGAQGVMQLMPTTAKGLGVTDSFDAKQNIMGGAKYISGLLKKYDGNVKLALAAYNAGSGNVAKYGGVPPFEETQNYVKKVMNYMGQNIKVSDEYNYATNQNDSNQTANTTNVLHVASVGNPTSIQRNYSYLLSNDTTNTTSLEDLDTLFSYDDYMKFLDILMLDEKDDSKEDNSGKNGNYTDINYNPAVLNLLIEQKLN